MRHVEMARGLQPVLAGLDGQRPDQLRDSSPLRVQEAIIIVFDELAELARARQARMWLLGNGLDLPAKRNNGEAV